MKVYLSLLISRFYSVLKDNKIGIGIYKILFLLCATSIFFLSSCKKEKEKVKDKYELTGTVVDIFTKQPIPSATVGIAEHSGIERVVKTVATTRSDVNGKFKLKFEVKSDKHRYELTAKKDNYFETLEDTWIEISNKQKSNMDIKLSLETNITFHIKGNIGGAIMSINGKSGDYIYRAGTDTTKSYYGVPLKQNSLKYHVLNGENIKNSDYGVLLYWREVYITPASPPDTAHYLIEF